MVILFMLFYYRLPGLLADMALVLYAGFLFAIIKLLGITLSLPGIAATVLTVGMAVDANVLIFERVKEELRAGRTMAAAIDIGFKRAWPSIRDSNASTLITCFILYWFGNTFGATLIIGFAINLGIGVADQPLHRRAGDTQLPAPADPFGHCLASRLVWPATRRAAHRALQSPGLPRQSHRRARVARAAQSGRQ